MPKTPAVVFAVEYVRVDRNVTPKPGNARSGHTDEYVPVRVPTPDPRTSCEAFVANRASRHEQPISWPVGRVGGSLVVRADACADGGETTWLLSLSVTVMVTK